MKRGLIELDNSRLFCGFSDMLYLSGGSTPKLHLCDQIFFDTLEIGLCKLGFCEKFIFQNGFVEYSLPTR